MSIGRGPQRRSRARSRPSARSTESARSSKARGPRSVSRMTQRLMYAGWSSTPHGGVRKSEDCARTFARPSSHKSSTARSRFPRTSPRLPPSPRSASAIVDTPNQNCSRRSIGKALRAGPETSLESAAIRRYNADRAPPREADLGNPASTNPEKPMSVLDKVLDLIDQDLDRSLDRLFSLLRIRSISTDPAYRDECRQAAEHLAKDL